MRSSLRLVAAALTLALCGTSTTPAEAAPAKPAPAPAARRARTEPTTFQRPSRATTEPRAAAKIEKKADDKKVEDKKPEDKKPDAQKAEDKKPAVPAESVGPPNDGRLQGGIKLDMTKPYLRVVPAYQGADTRWGLPALIHAIDRSAKAVNKKYPGSTLGVGDISRKSGGELANHHSHESGRDADLGFYVFDTKGQQTTRHGFLKIDEKLASNDVPGARFDVARNWLLLQNLLLDREARVSHIFVAEPIKHALLAHARSRGVSRALLVRASQVMMQPTGGLPHDDHFHVRISCPSSPKKSCIEIAKNAPSKARRLKMAKKGRGGMKTPARSATTTPKPAAPKRTAEAQNAGTNGRSRGIYLSRAAKAEGGPEVPVSLWALAGASIGGSNDKPASVPRETQEEAESDAVDVKDAIDDDGAPRITE